MRAALCVLRVVQHGDLNGGNILKDARGGLWLIDFAKADVQGPFTDAAKMISVILFEHFPVPLTVDEVRCGGVQKLTDAEFGLNGQAEAKLVELCQSSADKAELEAAVEAVEGPASGDQPPSMWSLRSRASGLGPVGLDSGHRSDSRRAASD